MRTLSAATAILIVATTLQADERCLARDTPRQCLRRLLAERVYKNAEAELAAFSTGSTDDQLTAVKNFTSPLTAQLDTATPSDSAKALKLDYNVPETHQRVNLHAIVADPQLSPAVMAEIGTDATAAAKWQQSLGRGDDVTASITFAHVTPLFGRTVEPHRQLLESIILSLVSDSVPTTAAVTADKVDTSFEKIVPDFAARITAMSDFQTAAAALVLPALVQSVSHEFARLVGNQSQLYAKAQLHHRAVVVGPKERTFSLTWEIGGANISDFRRAEGRDCESRGTCLEAFNDYANRATSASGNGRLALTVAYHSREQSDPKINSPSLFVTDDSHALRYALAYGREVNAAGKDGRIDLTFAYEQNGKTSSATLNGNISNRRVIALDIPPQILPASRTRLFAAVTLTRPITDSLSIPFSVIWTDKTEWLPGTSRPPIPISPPFAGNGHTTPFSTDSHKTTFTVGLQYRTPPSRPDRPQKDSREKCCCK